MSLQIFSIIILPRPPQPPQWAGACRTPMGSRVMSSQHPLPHRPGWRHAGLHGSTSLATWSQDTGLPLISDSSCWLTRPLLHVNTLQDFKAAPCKENAGRALANRVRFNLMWQMTEQKWGGRAQEVMAFWHWVSRARCIQQPHCWRQWLPWAVARGLEAHVTEF